MAGYNALNLGFIADSVITAGNVVYISDDNTVKMTSAASSAVVGVAYSSAADGGVVTVQVDGIAKVTAGGEIAAGALVVSAADGEVVTVGSGTFDQVMGRALTASADDQDEISILLI